MASEGAEWISEARGLAISIGGTQFMPQCGAWVNDQP
jgi:hypothetical protein